MKPSHVVLCLAVACASPRAQEVPDITDVYAADPPAESARLGPPADSASVLERYAACMRTCEGLDYEFTVAMVGKHDRETPVLRGAATVRRDDGGHLDRMRVNGRDVTDESGALVRLARITDLDRLGEPVAVTRQTSDGVPGVWWHFVDAASGEHVYVELAEADGMPRVVERVYRGPDGAPILARTRITGLRVERAK